VKKKGFTLIEVLIVLTVIALVFTLLSTVFYSNIQNSLNLLLSSEKLKTEADLFWNMQRKVFSAQEIYLAKGELYMTTSAGDYYQGVVKSAYIYKYKEQKLFYYEFPYPYGELKFYEEDKLIPVGEFKDFKILAYKGESSYEEFNGKPDYFTVYLDKRKFIIKP
jgi:prepilin-type N-terminal cleavage/methylation domain-containing protein